MKCPSLLGRGDMTKVLEREWGLRNWDASGLYWRSLSPIYWSKALMPGLPTADKRTPFYSMHILLSMWFIGTKTPEQRVGPHTHPPVFGYDEEPLEGEECEDVAPC